MDRVKWRLQKRGDTSPILGTPTALGQEAMDLELKRATEARALVAALERINAHEPLKICVMTRIKRIFNVSLSNESFTVMMHVVTCWLAEDDAANDALGDDFEAVREQTVSKEDLAWQRENGCEHFVYDADPDKAFYQPDFRPRVGIRNLREGQATIDGAAGEEYFFRSYVDGASGSAPPSIAS